MIAQAKADRRTLPKPRAIGRVQQIVEMSQFGMTLHEIGLEFGITRERVRQILNRERKDNPSIKKPRQCRGSLWVSIGTLKNKIGGTKRVNALIASGRIRPVQIGFAQYIPRSESDSLLKEWQAVRPRCNICRNIVHNSRGEVPLCGNCYRSRRGNRIRNEQNKLRRNSQAVVHKNSIHERIASGLKRGGKCTLSFSEAKQASGLTTMQLQYARHSRLISTKTTNRCNNAGGFVCLYSDQEMHQIAAMLREMSQERAK